MEPRTDQEIVDQTNELARLIYLEQGYQRPEGFRFDLAIHPHEALCWKQACVAQRLLTDTDPEDAIANLED